MGNYDKLIKENQADSLKQVLNEALKYHFSNFKKLEELAEPYSVKDRMGIVDAATRMKANTQIKFEVQAYVNHLRRLKHFINYLQSNGGFKEPNKPELKQVWKDIVHKDGVINILANKWAVHRSIDDPRGEDNSLHLAVLLNLEGAITMWGNGHLFLSIGRHEFYLFDYHPKALKFIKWVFEKIEK